MQPQSKTCPECGATYTRPPNRSHAQWDARQVCGDRCANAVRARGRLRQPGDLSYAEDPAAYQLAWQQRRAMPAWAAWWEQQRWTEDMDELTRVLIGGPCSPLKAKPKVRQFIAGRCPDCATSVVVVRGWWHDSIRCTSCTHRHWRGNNIRRAKRSGVEWARISSKTIFARDKGRCQICGRKTRGLFPAPTSPTIDHIVPLSKGGPHLEHNLQTACLRCNVHKGVGAANDQMRFAV